MRRWDKQPQKPSVKAIIDRRQLLLGSATLVVMAVLLAVGLTPRTAAAPDVEPETAQVAGDTTATLAADCEVIQHMSYAPCAHEVTRRQALPGELVGKNRAEAEKAWDQWRITAFSAKEVTMERTLDMYCPEHMVLMPDDSGMLCVFQNRYGDALAMVQELHVQVTELPEGVQEEVREGMGFGSLEDVEKWLESVES